MAFQTRPQHSGTTRDNSDCSTRRRITGRGMPVVGSRRTADMALVPASSKERNHVPVGISDFEAPQAVVDERQLFHKRRTALLEFGEQRIGVFSVDVRVPTS